MGDCGCGGPCCDEAKKRSRIGAEYQRRLDQINNRLTPKDEEKKFNFFARDADLDGYTQDGTPWQRRSRTLSHRAIGRGRKPVPRDAQRLRDLPFPYPTEETPEIPKEKPEKPTSARVQKKPGKRKRVGSASRRGIIPSE